MTSPSQAQRNSTEPPNAWALGQMGRAVLIVIALWLVSSQLYYTLVDALGLESGYDGAPVLFTAFYLAWSALVVGLFRFNRRTANAISHGFARLIQHSVNTPPTTYRCIVDSAAA